MTSCATAEKQNARYTAAVVQKEQAQAQSRQAGLVSDAVKLSANLPPWPKSCAQRFVAGIKADDRLDVALAKSDKALYDANARLTYCGRWYNQIKDGLGAIPKS